MAVGDVIADVSPTNTIVDYQPAVGVGVVITWQDGINVGVGAVMYDGSKQTSSSCVNGGSPTQNYNMKMMITNSNYLRYLSQGAGSQGSFSGMQIK